MKKRVTAGFLCLAAALLLTVGAGAAAEPILAREDGQTLSWREEDTPGLFYEDFSAYGQPDEDGLIYPSLLMAGGQTGWPDNEYTAGVPEPPVSVVWIVDEEGFGAEGTATKAQFVSYAGQLKTAGFSAGEGMEDLSEYGMMVFTGRNGEPGQADVREVCVSLMDEKTFYISIEYPSADGDFSDMPDSGMGDYSDYMGEEFDIGQYLDDYSDYLGEDFDYSDYLGEDFDYSDYLGEDFDYGDYLGEDFDYGDYLGGE